MDRVEFWERVEIGTPAEVVDDEACDAGCECGIHQSYCMFDSSWSENIHHCIEAAELGCEVWEGE